MNTRQEYPFRDFMELERMKRGLSNRELADLLGVSHTTVNSILRGKWDTDKTYNYQLGTLVRFATRLGVPLDVITSLLIPPELAPIASNDERKIIAALRTLPPDVLKAIQLTIDGYRVSQTAGDRK